ncbi:MAG: methyltransferase domain-containing protein [Chloroflexota bacterium]|nr:methyltransferase domain-containing protein [Chloroflexota bacterium]
MSDERKKVPQFVLPRGFAGRVTLMSMNRGHKAIYENVARALQLQPEDDLVDIACGNGHFVKNYASHVRSVAGLDLSELSIKLATRNNRSRVAAGAAQFVQGDASHLPWEDNRFSAATVMGGFPGIPQPVESLREMHRVLRPGGRAVVSIEWNAEDGKDHSKRVRQYGYRIWTEEEVRNLFKEAGFSDVSIAYGRGLMMPRLMIASGVKQ